jgi:hypothetical protein
MSRATTSAAQDAVSALDTSATPRVLDQLYQMSVDEYERLADPDFLEDRRVELINGWLVRKIIDEVFVADDRAPVLIDRVTVGLITVADLLP